MHPGDSRIDKALEENRSIDMISLGTHSTLKDRKRIKKKKGKNQYNNFYLSRKK